MADSRTESTKWDPPSDGERWTSPYGHVWTWGNGGRWAEGAFVTDARSRAQLMVCGWRWFGCACGGVGHV